MTTKLQKKVNKNIVYITHCIDTEGPLYESLKATFKRIYSIFGLQIEPSESNLKRLQNMEIDLGGSENEVARVLNKDMLAYHDTWDKIDAMLYDILNEKRRRKILDSFGNGWIYNWFCVDHVGYEMNPRRRDLGYHNIFDHYREILNSTKSFDDGIHFHYHPMPFSLSAHHCATHYFAHSDTLFQILARRIIDRNWFPCVYRPGFHTIRPDSHWFLEQYIPFDFSNQACDEKTKQLDLADGRLGDWRYAPKTWEPYHPHHDDYQAIGDCRRLVVRCLNIGTRVRCITQKEVNKAFLEASKGKSVILAFANHDFRNIWPNIEMMANFLSSAANEYPNIKFQFCEARHAVRLALNMKEKSPCRISLKLKGNCLEIYSDSPIFGPQPFFAIKTRCGKYYHDNLDFQKSFKSWTYVFDEQSIPLHAIEKVGLAANDNTGNVTVVVMDIDDDYSVKELYY